MKWFIALWLCLLMSDLQAQTKPWTDEEKLLGATALALNAIDFSQTAYGMRHGYREVNPFLGSHPSQDKIAAAFILTSLLGYYILDECDDQRKTGLYIAIGLKSIAISHNMSIGLKVRF